MIKKMSQSGSDLKPESWNMKPEAFRFAPSVQSDLFGYLKPQQQAMLKPYLRLIKRPYQEKLCTSLLDYLEGNSLNPLSEPVLATLQEEIVQVCSLRPLTNSLRSSRGLSSSREPKTIGTLIKQLFPSFSNPSNLLNR